MNIYSVIRLIAKQLKWLLILPVITAALMYLLSGNQTRVYSTKATLFTGIASGSSLSNLDNNRVDFFASKTAYNNLITIINSRKVLEETSLRLLSMHLVLKEVDSSILSIESFDQLNEDLPNSIKQLVDFNSVEQTYENLSKYISQDKSNYLYGLLNFSHPHYSHKVISSMKTRQVDGSDIIELSYSSNDPAVAYHTLNVLIDVFLREHGDLKLNQASAVIAYFEKQLNKASNELNSAEDRLLNFNKKNRIINYYEQTKHISSQQEKIEIKLHEIVLEYEAAEAILIKLEEEIQSRFSINVKNKDIIDIRESLIVVSHKIARLEIWDEQTEQASELLRTFVLDKAKLEQNLHQKIDSLYIYEKKSDGISIETLLNDWLNNIIEFESAKARLLAMKSKREEFNQLYVQFAPLGASLKRIEREIDVKEKSYLEILHHLGLAKLKQQNDELMANMKILDAPFLPIDAEPTKRMMLVVVIGVFTFMLTLLGFFAFELLDRTIKTPERLENHCEYKVAGTLPLINKQKLNWVLLTQKGCKTSIEFIIKKVLLRPDDKPIVVQVFSHMNGEGKSYVIQTLYAKLRKLNYSVINICFKQSSYLPESDRVYLDSNDLGILDYSKLTDETQKCHVIIVEIPSLSNTDYFLNPRLLSSSDLNFLVVDASRIWSKHDDFLKSHLNTQTNIKLYAILNKALPENMVEMIGEIPKPRTKIRSFIKHKIFKKYIS